MPPLCDGASKVAAGRVPSLYTTCLVPAPIILDISRLSKESIPSALSHLHITLINFNPSHHKLLSHTLFTSRPDAHFFRGRIKRPHQSLCTIIRLRNPPDHRARSEADQSIAPRDDGHVYVTLAAFSSLNHLTTVPLSLLLATIRLLLVKATAPPIGESTLDFSPVVIRAFADTVQHIVWCVGTMDQSVNKKLLCLVPG